MQVNFCPEKFLMRYNQSKKLLYEDSSNINEVIRTILNFFFSDKISQSQKSTNPLTANKNKKVRIKNF